MTPSSVVAVTDTCSIFPQTLRDVLLRTAEAGLYRIRWSEAILAELGRNLREERGLTEEQTQRLLTEMRRAFPEATVTGYEHLIGRMSGHPKDRHVIAAAVHTAAHVIVTENLRDFPDEALAPFNLEAQTSDEFLGYLLNRHPDEMARIIIDLNAVRKKPPEALSGTLDRLAKSVPRFVAQLIEHPSIEPRLGLGIVEGPLLHGEDIAPGPAQQHERAPLEWLGRTSPTMTLLKEWKEDDLPEIEKLLFDKMLRQTLTVSNMTQVHLETQPEMTLHVAVINAAELKDLAGLLHAHNGAETVTLSSRWTIFAKRKYAFLQIQAVAPVAVTFALGFSGPSSLPSALAINRQGRVSITTRTPTSEAEVHTTGLVWTFPFSRDVHVSLSRMI